MPAGQVHIKYYSAFTPVYQKSYISFCWDGRAFIAQLHPSIFSGKSVVSRPVLFAERVENTGIKTTYQVKPIYIYLDSWYWRESMQLVHLITDHLNGLLAVLRLALSTPPRKSMISWIYSGKLCTPCPTPFKFAIFKHLPAAEFCVRNSCMRIICTVYFVMHSDAFCTILGRFFHFCTL